VTTKQIGIAQCIQTQVRDPSICVVQMHFVCFTKTRICWVVTPFSLVEAPPVITGFLLGFLFHLGVWRQSFAPKRRRNSTELHGG
jgi:hypothetical protein